MLIVTSYALYQQKLLAGAYFEKIKLNHVNRVMRIYDLQGNDIVKATLGTTINYDKVLPCLPANNRDDGSICLEWMHRCVYCHYLNSTQERTRILLSCPNYHRLITSNRVLVTYSVGI